MAEPDDFKLIRDIVAGGWLNAFSSNISDVHYQVTERGKAAASR